MKKSSKQTKTKNNQRISSDETQNQPALVSWQYALLLIILFAIVSVAVAGLLEFSRDHITEDIFKPFAFSIWSITLALMFIGGAFGLYTVRYSVVIEGQKRVGRFVQAMDYFQDGLLLLELSGKILAKNPTAENYFEEHPELEVLYLKDVFPSLTKDHLGILLNRETVGEVETKISVNNRSTQYYRFRSQIDEQLQLIIISDITESNKKKMLSRQVAELSLISQISRGVANDLNSLLCDVAVHASLLGKLCQDAPEKEESVKAIENSVNRGIILSDQLLKISEANRNNQNATTASKYLDFVVGTLKNSLSDDWDIAIHNSVKNLSITIDRLQLERIIINLALLLVDTVVEPGILKISVNGLDDKSIYAMEILLDVSPKLDTITKNGLQINKSSTFRAPGAMESVISMLLQNINGKLDKFTSTMNSSYKILLPGFLKGDLFLQRKDIQENDEDSRAFHSFFEIKKILLYVTEGEKEIGRVLAGYGADVQKADDIVSVLNSLEKQDQHDCLIVNEDLIEQDGEGLLMAIRRLHATLPIIVISEKSQRGHLAKIDNACYLSEEDDLSELVNAVVKICS